MKLKQTKSYFYQQIIKQKIKIYPKKKKIRDILYLPTYKQLEIENISTFFFSNRNIKHKKVGRIKSS